MTKTSKLRIFSGSELTAIFEYREIAIPTLTHLSAVQPNYMPGAIIHINKENACCSGRAEFTHAYYVYLSLKHKNINPDGLIKNWDGTPVCQPRPLTDEEFLGFVAMEFCFRLPV